MNGTAKPIRRKDRTAEKRQPIPSGLAGTAPLRRAFGLVFRVVSFRGVCLSRRREAPALSYQRQAHATVANCFLKSGLRDNRSLIYYDESAIIILSR